MMAVATRNSYSGYYRRDEPAPDVELTQVGPGTPGGEYLRRFWHPVAYLPDLKDLPLKLRIMGEDLVLFRDGRGEIGLLNLHCSHRGTSLEFGMVERCGIRCCYHGWLYDVDGRVLETPGEPPDSTFNDRVIHGAYPVREYKGLVFAYMGPPDRQPEFPRLSSLEQPAPGWRVAVRPQRRVTDCHWLQLVENIIDHSHAYFLHRVEMGRARVMPYRPSANSEASLDDYFTRGIPEGYEPVYRHAKQTWQAWDKDWQEFPDGVLIFGVERHGDHVLLQVGGNYLMPNIVEFATVRRRGGPGAEINAEVGYEPPMATDWWVPVDDTHSIRIGFHYVPDSDDARQLQAVEPTLIEAEQPEGRESFTQFKRENYEARQWQPADYEAQTSQRPVAIHGLEHLGTTDRGVLLIRKKLRAGIRAVQRGEDPWRAAGGIIQCPCRNTVVRMPPAETPEADRVLLRTTVERFVAALVEGRDAVAAISQATPGSGGTSALHASA